MKETSCWLWLVLDPDFLFLANAISFGHKRSEAAIGGHLLESASWPPKWFQNPTKNMSENEKNNWGRSVRIYRDFGAIESFPLFFQRKSNGEKPDIEIRHLDGHYSSFEHSRASKEVPETFLKGWDMVRNGRSWVAVWDHFHKGNTLILIGKRGRGPISASTIADQLCVFLSAHRVHSNWFPSAQLRTPRLGRPCLEIGLNHAVFQ